MKGLQARNRSILARAITLIESRVPAHREKADLVLQSIMKWTGKAKRVGITGVPGVGKSTFIEALGCQLCTRGHHVAVLTVDPTSALSGGSILGDKTRMEQLSRHENAFIRPSAAGETLGGVARKTREAMMLCEAAGFDVVLVETVGVGQSETTVRSMVDFFLLMLLPGGGDELQGIKKGVVELADSLFVNKADGPNKELAEISQREYAGAVRGLRPATRGWHSEVYIGSAKTGEGLPEMWRVIERFFEDMEGAGFIAQRRREQTQSWLRDMVREELISQFFQDETMQARLQEVDKLLLNNSISVSQGVANLLDAFEKRRVSHDSTN
ncbi:MAG: putative GTPase [Elusimicrobia bacterium]|nr:putative GTPase [Elusimicrobiota bacterium]